MDNMNKRNTLAHIRSKGMKETKYVVMEWESAVEDDTAKGPVELADNNYYTQTVFYTEPTPTSQTALE